MKLRILMLLTDAFGSRGGIAQFNRDFITALSEQGDIEKVICLPRLMPYDLHLTLTKVDYRKEALRSRWKYFLACLKLVLGRETFDLVICGHINLLPFAYLIGWLTQKPIFLILFGSDAWTPPRRRWPNALYRTVRGCVSISQFTSDRFVRWSGISSDKIYLLPCCVDLARFSSNGKPKAFIEKYRLQNKKVLLTVGRITKEERSKGFELVIKALPRLVKKIKNLVYLVVGEGDDVEYLKMLAGNLGVEQQVIFTGFIDEKEKPDIYHCADVYVMPSKGEGFGIVYLEALAAGLTIIGSKSDAGQETLRAGRWGYLVDRDNEDSLIDGVLKAFQNPITVSRDELQEHSSSYFNQRCHSWIQGIIKSGFY